MSILLAVAALLGGAAPASAEEQPSIVKAYGLDWIERVREEAWPQPKDRRPVICLLDTGVAVTPDTPDDNLLGPIVARLALDGGTGLPQGDTFEHRHGTDMAAIIAAPRNGYGTVGVFPQARIVSVRVTTGQDAFITPAAMDSGVRACRSWVLAAGSTLAAVVMAESNYDQRPVDTDKWEKSASLAAQSGGVFVAAAGNEAGAESIPPASAANVLVIAAGGDNGDSCPFNTASLVIALLGPGCSDESVAGVPRWPAGSSAATAAVGALLGAMAARDPGVPPAARVDQLLSSAGTLAAGRRINGTPIADGFQGLIESLSPQRPEVAPIAAPLGLPNPPAEQGLPLETRQDLWRPSVVAKWSRSRLLLRRTGTSLKGRLRVLMLGSGGRRQERVLRGRKASWSVPWRPNRVEVWAEGNDGHAWRSLTRRAKVAR